MKSSSLLQRIFNRTKSDTQTELLTQLLEEQRRMANVIERLSMQLQQSTVRQTSTQLRIPKIISEQDLQTVPILHEFLAKRSIAIKTLRQRQEFDAIHDEIAVIIGSKYYHVSAFIDNIKRTMQSGQSFSMNLSQYSQAVIADITQLGRKFHDLAFLTTYHYQKSPKYLITARPNTLPEIQNFFSGQWLERYIYQVFTGIGRDVKASLGEAVLNPQIVLPNGDDFELDMLATANGRIYWIECKTGAYQDHIAKYSRFAQILQLPVNQTIMVLPDAHESLTLNLSRMFGMHVVNLSELHDHLDHELSVP